MTQKQTQIPPYPSNRFTIDGRTYLLVAVTKIGRNSYTHTLKNDRGEYKDMSDEALIQFTANATWIESYNTGKECSK